MDLDPVERLASTENGLCVVATTRPDGTAQTSVVNAGLLRHPVTGAPVVGFVTPGGTAKHRNLRARPDASVVFRRGWDWAGVDGPVELIGPDDPHPSLDGAGVARLLRDIFIAAGGSHDDWEEYDRVMTAERRLAVLLQPRRALGPRRG